MIPFHFMDEPQARPGEHAVVLPAKLETKANLFASLHKTIPLPDYFGHNWDALEECLGELAEQEYPKIALIHHDIPLAGSPADQSIYLEILAGAAWGSDGLSVIFPKSFQSEITRLLAGAK